jgi:hypothetical protein
MITSGGVEIRCRNVGGARAWCFKSPTNLPGGKPRYTFNLPFGQRPVLVDCEQLFLPHSNCAGTSDRFALERREDVSGLDNYRHTVRPRYSGIAIWKWRHASATGLRTLGTCVLATG